MLLEKINSTNWAFSIFHFDISGNDINDEQSVNIYCICVIFDVSHFDVSGNDIKDEHKLKIESILLTFLVSHFDISGNDINDEQKLNTSFIFLTLACPILIYQVMIIVIYNH